MNDKFISVALRFLNPRYYQLGAGMPVHPAMEGTGDPGLIVFYYKNVQWET